MKRFVKYTAILGAVMTVLGFGTAWAARVNGGRWNRKEILGSSISLPYFGRSHHFSTDDFSYEEAKTAQQLDENTLALPLTKDFRLDMEAGKVWVKTGEAQEIRIVCKDLANMEDLIQLYGDEDETNLYMGPASNVGYVEAEVILPKGYRFQDVEIFVGAGECHVEEILAEDLEVGVAQGRAEILNGGVHSAELQCAAGKLGYTGTISKDADCECATGRIDLILFQKETDFNYQAEGVGGNIRIGDSDFSGVAFSKERNYGASRDMELQCAAGSIQVSFTEKKNQEEN